MIDRNPHYRHTHRHSDRPRWQATPFTVVGSLAAAGLVLAETGRLVDTVTRQTNNLAKHEGSWRKLGFMTATVAIGALMVAAVKQSHASRVDNAEHEGERSR